VIQPKYEHILHCTEVTNLESVSEIKPWPNEINGILLPVIPTIDMHHQNMAKLLLSWLFSGGPYQQCTKMWMLFKLRLVIFKYAASTKISLQLYIGMSPCFRSQTWRGCWKREDCPLVAIRQNWYYDFNQLDRKMEQVSGHMKTTSIVSNWSFMELCYHVCGTGLKKHRMNDFFYCLDTNTLICLFCYFLKWTSLVITTAV